MQPDIRPSSDLRNHYAEVARGCKDERRATVLTVNGRGDTVLMGIEDWQEQQARLELLETLVASAQDISAGRVASMQSTLDDIRSWLAKGAV